jgi:hypothetical protein
LKREEVKLQILREAQVDRQKEEAKRRAHALWKAEQHWLQTEYPMRLGRKLVRKMKGMKDWEITRFKTTLRTMSKQNWFRATPRVPYLWEPNRDLLVRCGEARPPYGGPPRSVRCSAPFESFLSDEVPQSRFGADVITRFGQLLDATAPGSFRYVWQGPRSVARMLHVCNYNLDFAFVHCVITLSKWITADDYPYGVYDWPPPIPADVLPTLPPELPPALAPAALPPPEREQPLSELGERGREVSDAPFPAMSSRGHF